MLNGVPIKRVTARKTLVRWVHQRIIETIAASIPIRPKSAWLHEWAYVRLGPRRVRWATLLRLRRYLADADLRAVERELDLRDAHQPRPRRGNDRLRVLGIDTRIPIIRSAERFLEVSRLANDLVYAGCDAIDVALMTRPPSAFDIAIRWSQAGQAPNDVVGTLNSLRGTRYRQGAGTIPWPIPVDAAPARNISPNLQDCWVILGNHQVDERWFYAALRGTPVTKSSRAEALAAILKRAISQRRTEEAGRTRLPILVILPELSMPRRWIRYFAQSLWAQRIGLIAGLEYEVRGTEVSNQAIGTFPGSFRHAGSVALWHKTQAAALEAEILRKKKLTFTKPTRPRTRVDTEYGSVSALICSEMLDIKVRCELLGRVDMVAVPSWNKDTATFDHTVQTTAADLHCFVAVANNAEFSDSRMFVPKRERHQRDVGRLILCRQNEAISVRISALELRTFQLGVLEGKSLPKKLRQLFKPLPPGYEFLR